MGETIIRQATYQDLPHILSILNNEILTGVAVYDYEIKSIDFITNWFDEKISNKFPLLVAIEDNELLGYATYGSFRPREGYKFTIEHSVYLTSSGKGKGIGRKLMLELISIAKVQNYHRMLAVIDASNEGSCNFHKRLGFIETGRMNEIGYKFDKWLDAIIMQLNLDLIDIK